MRLAMDRIAPVRRETRVKLGPLPTKTAADVSRASEELVDQAVAGKLSIDEAQRLGELLEMRRRAIETENFDQRLRALESKHANA
jgi:ribosomal protein L13E